jgi:hypothetical protein
MKKLPPLTVAILLLCVLVARADDDKKPATKDAGLPTLHDHPQHGERR